MLTLRTLARTATPSGKSHIIMIKVYQMTREDTREVMRDSMEAASGILAHYGRDMQDLTIELNISDDLQWEHFCDIIDNYASSGEIGYYH